MTVEQIVAQYMDEMMDRDDWGAQYRNGGGDRTGAYPLSISVLHHGATRQLPVTATRAQEAAEVRSLEYIGQSRFKWGISYNGGVFPSGTPFQGIGWSRIGAHTGGYNTVAWAQVLAGNTDVNQVTPQQVETLAMALVTAWASGVIAQPKFTHCHHDLNGTSCPGRYGCAARQRINARAAQLVAGKGTVPASPEPGYTGPGPFEGFIVATEDGELRRGPSSFYGSVLTVKAGQVLNASEGETTWYTGVGDYFFPNRRVEKSNGVKRRGLLPGDWPMRDMPRNGKETDELDFAWRELLTQVGYDASNVWTAKLDWLADRDCTEGNGHARMQQALAERTAPNGEPFYQGQIDGHQGPIQLNAEIDWLNWQRQFLDVAPKHYSHY